MKWNTTFSKKRNKSGLELGCVAVLWINEHNRLMCRIKYCDVGNFMDIRNIECQLLVGKLTYRLLRCVDDHRCRSIDISNVHKQFINDMVIYGEATIYVCLNAGTDNMIRLDNIDISTNYVSDNGYDCIKKIRNGFVVYRP